MVTVYVNAWMYKGGSGFDWYHSKDAADHAFELEKESAEAFSDQDHTAFRFDVQVDGLSSATDFIDENLDELCKQAVNKHGPIKFPYNP